MHDETHNEKKFIEKLVSKGAIDKEEFERRKLFFTFLLLQTAGLIAFGTYQVKAGSLVYGISDIIGACLLICLLYIVRRLKRGIIVFRICTLLLVILMFYWLWIGAIKGYSSIWMLAAPPYFFFLMGLREGSLWTLFTTLYILFCFFNPFSLSSMYSYEGSFVARHLATLFVIIWFTYNYESVKNKFKGELILEQEKLVTEKNLLQKAKSAADSANTQLKKEMEERKKAEEELKEHHDKLEEIVDERTLEVQTKNKILMETMHELTSTNKELSDSKEKLSASEKRYKLVADNINDFIWATDLNKNFTYISPSVKNMFGYTIEEAMELPPEKWNTPKSFKKIINTYLDFMRLEKEGKADTEADIILELEQIKKDGTIIWVELRISIIRDLENRAIGFVGVTRDISERVAAQQEREKIYTQLSQAQKMEAIGTLVGGIAHDFNNILSGIVGSLDLIENLLEKETLTEAELLEGCIDVGKKSTERAAILIQQLLAMSKKHDIKMTPVIINKSLKNIQILCKNSFPKSVELDFHIPSEMLTILGDPVQIEQVILNLCINASHAMTTMREENEKSGGKLSVNAEHIGQDSSIKLLNPEAGEYDSWICIKVIDSGVGIAPETQERIFEPFFSTKRLGEGTGLGLATTYNIVSRHDGFVHVDSEPGKGTEFSVYLPSYDRENEEIIHHQGIPVLYHGSGTILVIDDEEIVLRIARGILEQCGYTVLHANNGKEGINIYKEQGDEISGIIIDLSMPDKTGLEVFRELKIVNPKVKALLCSGMLDNESKEEAMKLGIKDIMHKPYTASELSHKLKDILE